jgi:hypothetical protein
VAGRRGDTDERPCWTQAWSTCPNPISNLVIDKIRTAHYLVNVKIGVEPGGMMAEQTTSTSWILRIGATAGIVGALLGLVGNLLHPATPTGDPEGVARAIADSQLWVADHLAIVLGLILMLGGLVALAHSIQDGLPGALARLGSIAAVAGITVGLILVTLDGLAAPRLAEAWATAPPGEQATALRLVLAQETLNFALAALFNILFAGVTFILYGLAVAWSRLYPRWLGWVAVAAGVGSVLAGLIQASAGQSTTITQILTIIFPTVITLWLIEMGVLSLRRAAKAKGPDRNPGRPLLNPGGSGGI